MNEDRLRALLDDAVAPLTPAGPAPALLARTSGRRRRRSAVTGGVTAVAVLLVGGAVAVDVRDDPAARDALVVTTPEPETSAPPAPTPAGSPRPGVPPGEAPPGEPPALPADGAVALLEEAAGQRLVVLQPDAGGRARVVRTLAEEVPGRLDAPVFHDGRVWYARTDEARCRFEVLSEPLTGGDTRVEVAERPGIAVDLTVSASGLAVSYGTGGEGDRCGVGLSLLTAAPGGAPRTRTLWEGDDDYADLALSADGRLAVAGGPADEPTALLVLEPGDTLREVPVPTGCSPSAVAWSGPSLYAALDCSSRLVVAAYDRLTLASAGNRPLAGAGRVVGLAGKGADDLLVSRGLPTRPELVVLEVDGALRPYLPADPACPTEPTGEGFCRWAADW